MHRFLGKKNFSPCPTRHRALIFRMSLHLVELHQVCSNYGLVSGYTCLSYAYIKTFNFETTRYMYSALMFGMLQWSIACLQSLSIYCSWAKMISP